MAIKSAFSTEIGEGFDKFKEFEKLFTKYRTALGTTPSAYASTTAATKEQEKALKGMTAAILAQLEVIRQEEKVQTRIESSTARTADHWKTIATHARSFWGTMTSMVRRDAILGALGLAGTMFALDRLGGVAGAGLRTSSGLGTTYGGMSSFGLTYGRVMDPGSLLGAVSQARGNLGGPEWSAMQILGVGQSGDTAKLAKATLQKVYEHVQRTPEELWGPMLLEGFGIGSLGFGMEDLRRLKGMNRREFDRYSGQFDSRAAQLAVNEDTLRKWQDFVNTLDVTGKRIESSLIRGLVKASGPLEKLSDAAASFIEKFIGSKGFEWVIGKITSGLDTFANYIGTDKFKEDLKDLANGIADVAKWVMEWAKWIRGPSGEESMKERTKKERTGGAIGRFIDDIIGPLTRKGYLPDGTKIEDQYPTGYSPTSAKPMGTMGALLDLIAKLEGSGDNAVSPAGAIGKFQIMPSTAAAYGVTREQLFDPAINRATAEKIVGDLNKRYTSVAQILAAYNAGPQIADYMKAHGDKSLPSMRPDGRGSWNYQETQEYLRRAGIKVTIDNQTGGTINTQVDSMAGGLAGNVP